MFLFLFISFNSKEITLKLSFYLTSLPVCRWFTHCNLSNLTWSFGCCFYVLKTQQIHIQSQPNLPHRSNTSPTVTFLQSEVLETVIIRTLTWCFGCSDCRPLTLDLSCSRAPCSNVTLKHRIQIIDKWTLSYMSHHRYLTITHLWGQFFFYM